MKIWNKEKPLEDIIKENEIVILEFGTNICAACTGLREKLDLYIRQNPDIQGYYIPIEPNAKEVAQFHVFSGPTIQVYVQGKLTTSKSGYFSLEQIIDKIQRYKDMLN